MAARHIESQPEFAAFERQLAELRGELAATRAEVERVRSARGQARLSIPALAAAIVVACFGRPMTAQVDAQRVTAPFEVVAPGGEVLMKMSDEGLRVGKVLIGTGKSNNGFISIGKANGTEMIGLGSRDGAPGVYILDAAGNKPLAGLALAPKVGAGVIYVSDSAGVLRMLMSGIGELHAADATGRTRATVTQDGAFTARNAAGITVARFGETGGVGKLQLANSVGDSIVEAGQLVTGAGIVRAYPIGTPGMAVLGLPGTFITGFLGAKKSP